MIEGKINPKHTRRATGHFWQCSIQLCACWQTSEKTHREGRDDFMALAVWLPVMSLWWTSLYKLNGLKRPKENAYGTGHTLNTFDQGCTNPRLQVTVANEVCTGVPQIFGFWVWNLLHVTVLAPRIVRWLLDFWKICAFLPWTSPPPICHLSPIEHAWDKVKCFVRSNNVTEAFSLNCLCKLTDATLSWATKGAWQDYCHPSEDSLRSIIKGWHDFWFCR